MKTTAVIFEAWMKSPDIWSLYFATRSFSTFYNPNVGYSLTYFVSWSKTWKSLQLVSNTDLVSGIYVVVNMLKNPPKCKNTDLFYYKNYRMCVFHRFHPLSVTSHFCTSVIFRLKLTRQTGEQRPYLERWDPERAVSAFDKVQWLTFGHEACMRCEDISAMDQSERTPRATQKWPWPKLKAMRQTLVSSCKKATGAH